MFEYKPYPLEHFGKSARKMADIANRRGQKIFAIIGGIKFVAKPGRSHWGLIKFHEKEMTRDYMKRYFSLEAMKESRDWWHSQDQATDSLSSA